MSADALPIVLGAVFIGLYLVGARRLPGVAWRRRSVAFCLGVVTAALAVLPPLDAVGERSFPVHMGQHMVLLFVAGPLLALGGAGLPLLLGSPRAVRRRLAGWRGSALGRRARASAVLPVLAVAAHTAVLWGWHLPSAYTAALQVPLLHALEHASFLAIAIWFWMHLCTPGRHRLHGGVAVGYVFVTALPTAALGAFLTLASSPIYPAQTGLGAGALAEQQLAGLVMWVPADVLYLAVCAALVLLELGGLHGAERDEVPLPPVDLVPVQLSDARLQAVAGRESR